MAEREQPTNGENGTPPAGTGRRRSTRETRPGDFPNPLPISLVDIVDYERLHQGQALTLRDFFATMNQERRRGEYGYLHAVITATSQQRANAIYAPEGIQKYARDLHVPLFWAEMRTLDSLPFLSLRQKLTLLVGNLFERAHYELPTELFGMNRQTIDSCRDYMADGKTVFNGSELRQLAASYLANPEQRSPEDRKLQEVLTSISDRTPAGAAARRERNVAFTQTDIIGRLGLFLRSIDDMADTTLEQRFALFHQAYRQLYRNGTDTNRLTSPLFIMTQLIVATNLPIRLLGRIHEPLPPQLHQRWSLLVGRNVLLEKFLRSPSEFIRNEDSYTVMHHWLLGQLTTGKDIRGFLEINYSLPSFLLTAQFFAPDSFKNISRREGRLRTYAQQLTRMGLLPEESLQRREQQANKVRGIIQSAIDQARNGGNRISLEDLAVQTSLHPRTVQLYLHDMGITLRDVNRAKPKPQIEALKNPVGMAVDALAQSQDPHVRAGVTLLEIQRYLTEQDPPIHASEATLRRVLDYYAEDLRIEITGIKKRGKKTSGEVRDKILAYKGSSLTPKEIVEELKAQGIEVSDTTVWRILREKA